MIVKLLKHNRAMKNFLLILFFSISFSATAFANGPVPKVVINSFIQLYPQIECPVWENGQDGIVATFLDIDGIKKAFFEENGRWLETRIQIQKDQLPEEIDQFLQKNYGEANIIFCGKVYSADGEWYRVESELPDRVVLKNLDEEGQLIEEESIFSE